MKYSSTLTVESKAFPGVTFVIRKMTEKRRTDFNLKTAAAVQKIQSLTKEAALIAERVGHSGDTLDTETRFRIEALNAEMISVIQGQLNPEYVRWGLKSVSGLDVEAEDPREDDIPIKTAEDVIALAPPELFEEICGSVIAASGMSEEELKNFKLPSISGTPMVGTDPSGSVPIADTADESTAATVENISPAES